MILGGYGRAGFNIAQLLLQETSLELKLLQHLGPQIKQSGRYFTTEAGFMPGMPSTMAFLAAKRLESLQSLQFGMLEREKSGGYGSA